MQYIHGIFRLFLFSAGIILITRWEGCVTRTRHWEHFPRFPCITIPADISSRWAISSVFVLFSNILRKNVTFLLEIRALDLFLLPRIVLVAQESTCMVGVEEDGKLCLARVGLFDECGEDLTICPTHRNEFGLGWRPSKVCKYPEHQSKQKPYRGISRVKTRKIYWHFGVLCVTGRGKSL